MSSIRRSLESMTSCFTIQSRILQYHENLQYSCVGDNSNESKISLLSWPSYYYRILDTITIHIKLIYIPFRIRICWPMYLYENAADTIYSTCGQSCYRNAASPDNTRRAIITKHQFQSKEISIIIDNYSMNYFIVGCKVCKHTGTAIVKKATLLFHKQ